MAQSATNSVAKAGPGDQGSSTCKATFDTPTAAGSLILIVALVTGGLDINTTLSASGFTPLLSTVSLRDVAVTAWYRQAAPSMTSASVSTSSYRGINVRMVEVRGVAQSSALDKMVWSSGENTSPKTGSTGTLAQAGEFVFGVVANQYDTTTQFGFGGGLTRLYENTVPGSAQQDWEKGRVTHHQGLPTTTASQSLTASLSTSRRWIAFLATFKSGITGPARFTATTATTAIKVSGRGNLTVFGPLKVTGIANRVALEEIAATRARIGPFDYQYRLGGWSGLLIGAGTPYPVESISDLEGWAIRTSDDDQPRNDGAVRGIDLQSARTVLFKLSTSTSSGNRAAVEAQLAALYAALTPQRDTDQELIWRHPGRPLRTVYYRPTDLLRNLSREQALASKQSFSLRMSDPRHYSALVHTLAVPVAADDTDTVTVVGATNVGNARAYPLIRITGPASGPDVTRVQLVNATANVAFDVVTALQAKAELVGDMPARVTAAHRSVVTLNGQSKYGAWQMPREPFYLAADPAAVGGMNLLYARTTPTGAPVTVTIEYRDTWAG